MRVAVWPEGFLEVYDGMKNATDLINSERLQFDKSTECLPTEEQYISRMLSLLDLLEIERALLDRDIKDMYNVYTSWKDFDANVEKKYGVATITGSIRNLNMGGTDSAD